MLAACSGATAAPTTTATPAPSISLTEGVALSCTRQPHSTGPVTALGPGDSLTDLEPCAAIVLVTADAALAAVAASFAALADGIVRATVPDATELVDLGVSEVVTFAPQVVPDGEWTVTHLDADPVVAAAQLARRLNRPALVAGPADHSADLLLAALDLEGVAVPLPPGSGPGRRLQLTRVRPRGLFVSGLDRGTTTGLGVATRSRPQALDTAQRPERDALWVIPSDQVAAAGPIAARLGASVVVAPDRDPRADEDFRSRARPLATAGHVWTLDTEPGLLASALFGAELPGGGQLLFPDRRLVAAYGHPNHPGLGVLGEQSPAGSIALARRLAEPYDGEVPALPAFNLIVTVAAAEPTPDGDYSRPLDPATVREWVDAAGEAGVYVVLDLQPGRTDFLTQARQYEEFLVQAHVGLALDPEWRLGPTQVHLRQIGSVTAGEINAVSAWLADLVDEHLLPQKLLMIHQFQQQMIRDRDDLVTDRPQLATLIQMDGQGSQGAKRETYANITRGFESRVWWGWKNFYDEDRPIATPQQTLTMSPTPWFVSYQ